MASGAAEFPPVAVPLAKLNPVVIAVLLGLDKLTVNTAKPALSATDKLETVNTGIASSLLIVPTAATPPTVRL